MSGISWRERQMDELKDLVEELEHENEQLKQEKQELVECLKQLNRDSDSPHQFIDWLERAEELIKKYKG